MTVVKTVLPHNPAAMPVDTTPAVLIIGDRRGNVRWLWKCHLTEQGYRVDVAQGEEDAILHLQDTEYGIIVLDLMLQRGSALSVSDYTNFKWPATRLLFVNSDDFLADGTIFHLCSNACAMISADSSPSDVAAMVAHYGTGG